jgi:YjzC-like protein
MNRSSAFADHRRTWSIVCTFSMMEELGMETLKPGKKAPDSGELVEIGPRGGKVEDGRRLVIERGETIPPTSEPGNQFRYKRGSKTTH